MLWLFLVRGLSLLIMPGGGGYLKKVFSSKNISGTPFGGKEIIMTLVYFSYVIGLSTEFSLKKDSPPFLQNSF